MTWPASPARSSTRSDRDQDAELERLLTAGVTLIDIGQPAEASWHVLADPEGSEFCLPKRRFASL